MIDDRTSTAKTAGQDGSSLGTAIYPGKEAWKDEAGNRYTPEELKQMEKDWDIVLTNPNVACVRRAD